MDNAFNDPRLQELRTASETATKGLTADVQAGYSLPDMLREALNKKFSTDNPLMQTREGQLKTYMGETTQAPLDYTAKSAGGLSDIVYNPLQQANLIQQRRAGALAPLTSTNTLLGLQTGGINDIIDAATRAYSGYTAGEKGKAELTRQSYTDYLTELSKKADEAYRYAALAEKGAGTDTTGLASLLALLMAGTQGGQTGQTATIKKVPTILDYNNALTKGDQQEIQRITQAMQTQTPIDLPKPTLTNPQTRETYSYDGYDDPDYIADSNSGFVEAQ